MLNTLTRGAPGRTLGVLALVVAAVGFVGPEAAGVDVPSGHSPSAAQGSPARGGPPLRGVVRVERDFTVAPHSLATNQLLACPTRTRLTGGGTSLIGEPLRPADAPVVYTNGPVGSILAGGEQSWASEVANTSAETFTYRQFALCARSR
jgi:hypothetical protein